MFNSCKELVVRLKDQRIIAIDSCIDDASNFDFQLKAFAISYRENEAYYIPVESGEKANDVYKRTYFPFSLIRRSQKLDTT